MVIRRATSEDRTEVTSKVKAFNARYFDIPVDLSAVVDWFHQHLDIGYVYLSDDGLISALVIKDPVRNHIVMAETAWYDPGKEGLALLDTLVAKAREVEVDEVRMTTLNTTPEYVERLLMRKGFETIEKSHRLLI